MTSRWLYRLANASPLGQAAVILCAVAVLAGLFVGDYAVFGSTPAHRKVTIAAASPSPTPSPEAAQPSPVTATTSTAVVIPVSSTVAMANANVMLAYSSPSTRSSVVAHLTQHNVLGQVTPYLVIGTGPAGWVQVLLPVKPNGTTGWFPPQDVTLTQDNTFLLANLSTFTLSQYVSGQLSHSYPIGVGLPSTPTPTGMFYVYGIQQDPGPPYDPVILALSAFSPTLVNWPLGGIIGIHGWSDTSVEGKQVSNGCMRMRPSDITNLENSVPMGTPVDIVA